MLFFGVLGMVGSAMALAIIVVMWTQGWFGETTPESTPSPWGQFIETYCPECRSCFGEGCPDCGRPIEKAAEKNLGEKIKMMLLPHRDGAPFYLYGTHHIPHQSHNPCPHKEI